MSLQDQYEKETGKVSYQPGGVPEAGYVDWLEDQLAWKPPEELLKGGFRMNVWTDEFKRGDKVQVWDDDSSNKHKRIFLTYIEGAYKPFICTANEERFYNNNSFVTVGWKYAERIPEKKYWTFPDGSPCGVDNV